MSRKTRKYTDYNTWIHTPQAENNCISIFKFLCEHPFQNVGYYRLSNALNLPKRTTRILIQSGKAEAVALKYGYKMKVIKKKPNCAEVVYWGINGTQGEYLGREETDDGDKL